VRSLIPSPLQRPFLKVVMSVAGLLVTAVTVDADHPQTADQFAQQELAKKVVGANLHKICLPDFIDHSGGPSLLGQHIAAILSNLLAKKAKGFTVVSRLEIHKYLARNGWADHDLTSAGVRARFISDFQTDAILWGTISVDHGFMILELSARDPSWSEIFRSRYEQTLDPNFLADLDAAQSGTSYSFAGVDGVTFPKCLACPIPKFPTEARTERRASLSAIITTGGRVTDVRIMKSAEPVLDRAAIQAVGGWSFTPAHDPDGKPVAVRIPIEISFRRY